jgi:two-component system sensor histidine kinase YesM
MRQANRLSLSSRLFLYFVIIIILSLSLVGFISYFGAVRILDGQQEKQLSQIITSTAHQTELYLQSYERASNVLISQDEVKRFLDINPRNSYDYIYYADKIKQNAMRTTFQHYPHINSIYVLGRHGRYVLENNYITSEFPIEQPTLYYDNLMSKMVDTTRLTILRTSLKPELSHSVVTLVRPLRGYSAFDYNGLLAIELNIKELSTIWVKLDIGENGTLFIVDGEGKLIYHPDSSKLGVQLDTSIADPILAKNDGTQIMSELGEERLFVWKNSPYSGWKLVISLPVEELRKPVTAIRWVVISVGLFTLAVGLWLAYRFAQSINRPIQVLKEGMRQTERGVWREIPVGERMDEIGLLIHSYNLMVHRLSEMIEKVYAAELDQQNAKLALRTQQLERQRAEFQALQLQINPHFLYNTLETINCYAIIRDTQEIREIVDAMAFMLRYASQTNLKEITVANELNHVRYYLLILKHRLEQEFEIDVVIPPGLLLEKMVRFTLQPLIENAFEHAFRKQIAPQHKILINARMDNDNFYVTVEDNGKGMTQERLNELRDKLYANRLAYDSSSDAYEYGGIGVMNVHRRIQLVFGEQYGLEIESGLNEGTIVTMKLPKDQRDTFFGT